MRKIILFIIILAFVCPVFANFISSKTSQIFHKRDCRYAQALNDDNANIYELYADAIAEGLRPCLVCEPQPDPDISDPDPDTDPDIIILPPKQASTIIPISGVVLQMNDCEHPYTARSVGELILIKEQRAVALQEALDLGMSPCLYFSERKDPIYPTTEPENIDPNTLLLDQYGRSLIYWLSYFYNIMTTFNYNHHDPNGVQYLSARQMDWLENIHAAYINYSPTIESNWSFYVIGTDGEAYDITLFLKNYIDQTIDTGKFIYGTMIDIEDYERNELIIFQTIINYSIAFMEEHYSDTLKQGKISYPITPLIPPAQPEPIDYNQIVYITLISNFYHPENCGHFAGHDIKMINRESEVIATNNATWYPESGILTWRVTPFEIGDYIAITNSDIGQTELAAITVRPTRIPTMQNAMETWLKGNFNMNKYAEWASIYPGTSSTGIIDRNISWIFEDGRWIPRSGVSVDNNGRILTQEEHEIISETTEKHRTTRTYERPLSTYSVVWEVTKIIVEEITTTNYIREGDATTPGPAPAAGSTSRIEWTFEDGAWKPVAIGEIYPVNPYVDSMGYPDEEKLLAFKPIAPIKPDPDAVDEEEARLKSLLETSPLELKPLIEGLMASSPPRATYEEKLIKYGAELAEYEKNLNMWEEIMKMIEQEATDREEMEIDEMDRGDRMIEEMILMQEENKITLLTELLEDSKITDEQKGTLREILNVIKEN